jgi:hypothetical protein
MQSVREIVNDLWTGYCVSITAIYGKVMHPNNIFHVHGTFCYKQEFAVDITACTDWHIFECKYSVHFL